MKYWILIKNSLRKSKVTCVILVLLVSVATMLCIVAVNAFNLLNKNISDLAKETNMSQFTSLMPEYFEEPAEGILSDMDGIREYIKKPVLYYESTSIRDCDCQESGQDIPLIFGAKDEKQEISRLNLVMKSEQAYENGIYLPYYLHVAEGYELDDKIEITIMKEVHTFVAEGFYLDLNFCSPSMLTMYYVLTKDDMFRQLSKEAVDMNRFIILLCRAEENVAPNELEVTFSDELNQLHVSSSKMGTMLNADTLLSGIAIYPQIIMGVILGFAAILIFIAIVVIRFAILTHIEQNYRNLGVMEAAGYTSKNLVTGMTGQFTLIAFVGVVLGTLLSYIGKKPVSGLLEVSSGLKWDLDYTAPLILLVILWNLVLIAVITALLSLRIRKITVLNALREGIKTHNFKHNYFPCEKSHLPLNLLLGLKNLFTSGKQNISIMLIIAVLCSSMVLAFTMYHNFHGNTESDIIWDFIGTDRGDIIFITQNEMLRKEILQKEEIVKNKAINFSNAKISYRDAETMVSVKVSDDYQDFSNGVLLEGRYPKYNNEISLTVRIAGELNAVLNDTIEITIDDCTKEFLVVGISQQINNLGRSSAITLAGIHRMLPDFAIDTNYLTLNQAADIDTFIEQTYEEYGQDEMELINYNEMLAGVTTSYVKSMGILSIVSFTMTLLIICLVLFLLVNIKVLSDTGKNAVNKALGFTTGQLMIQTITSFLPSIILGCLVGILIGIFGSNTIIAGMMSFAGIKKCYFEVPIPLTLGAATVLILVSVIVAMLSSLKIKNVTPAKMFTAGE